MRLANACPLVIAVAAALTAAAPLESQETPSPGTADVFARFGPSVVKVEVQETSAGSRSGVGSGFYVSADGLVVTNYHVVRSVVFEPDDYRIVVRELTGDEGEAELLAVDAVNDLAVLRTDRTGAPHLRPAEEFVPQGARLYSLGHPHDLGLSIVEGTYNGIQAGRVVHRIHFTGSVNPGMSGGPAITGDGSVVGINVSTAGDQVSFLVPVPYLRALVDRTRTGPLAPSPLAGVRRQLHEYQETYLRSLFLGGGTPLTTMGEYTVPTRPADAFRCWGDLTRVPNPPYRVMDHICSAEDPVLISGDQMVGTLEFHHQLVRSDGLNRFQFHALISSLFLEQPGQPPGQEDHVTSFRCQPANVALGGGVGLSARTVVCARRYRKLDGLYDVVVKVATLGGRTEALLSTLTLSGVSFENARVMAYRYLMRFRWNR